MTRDVHVYRINMSRLVVLPVIWLAGAGLLLGYLGRSADAEEAAAGVLAALLLTLIVGPIFYFGVWRSRLELDAQGITHFQLGYTLRSSWENTARLSLQPGREGLYLLEPATSSQLLRVSAQMVRRLGRRVGAEAIVGDAEALSQGRFIALMPFSDHLRRGPLLQDFRRWAPHLV